MMLMGFFINIKRFIDFFRVPRCAVPLPNDPSPSDLSLVTRPVYEASRR